MKASCCTRSTTDPMVGIIFLRVQKVPCNESSMWGDYHARELALYVGREAEGKPYYTFFGPSKS